MKHVDTIFEHTQDALFLIQVGDDGTFTVESVNRAYEELTGLSRETLRGKTPRELLGDEQGTAVEARYHECVEKQAPIEYDEQLRIGGETIYWHTRLAPVFEADSVVQLVGATRDITDRKERNRKLREERTFIEQALDTLPDPFYVVNPDGGLRRWNDRLREVSGYSEETIAEMDAVEFFSEDERERIADAIDEALAVGESTVEADLLTADGERIPHEFTGGRLIDAEGNVTGLVGVGRDISERKRRVEILRTLHNTTQAFSEAPDKQTVADYAVETARTVLDQPLNTIWFYNEHDEVLSPVATTDAARSLVGDLPTYTGGESLSWRAFETGEMYVHDDLQATSERYNPETPLKSEIVLPLGEYGVMNLGATEPMAFDEFDVSLARILGDVVHAALARADREQNLRSHRQQLERQNERLEEFTSVVTHDLRNPLQLADGRLELLREECESDHIDDVAHALDRMDTLIDDLLTLAREGETVGEMKPVELADLTEACWKNIAAPKAEIVIDCERTVRADRSRLQQLLENLLRNAIEHGGSDVTITIGEVQTGFYIEDDGPGMPEADRDDLLKPGSSTSAEGVRFGLRIVKNVVDAHGWEITVAEGEQGGARFEITNVEFQPA